VNWHEKPKTLTEKYSSSDVTIIWFTDEDIYSDHTKKTHGKTECSNQEEICRNELQCLHSAYTTDVQLQVSSHKLLMLLYSELQWL